VTYASSFCKTRLRWIAADKRSHREPGGLVNWLDWRNYSRNFCYLKMLRH